MRITIMGSGGTGAYYGACLSRAGFDVTFIARGAHLAALQTTGLHVSGKEEFHLPEVKAVQDPVGLPPADVIIFAVKAYDTEQAAELIRPIVGPSTMILPIQNGVESYERVGAVLGSEKVVGGLCRISAEIGMPGTINLYSTFKEIILGEMDGSSSPRIITFAKALEKAEIPYRVSTEVRTEIWKKFAFIAAFSAITGVTRSAIGPIRACPETFDLYRQMAAEIVALANAEGVPLSQSFPDDLVKQASAMFAEMKSSLLMDLERGRRIEVETLQGAVVRLGKKNGIPTPVTGVICALLKMHQSR